MKRTIIMLLCIGIMIGCGKMTSNNPGDIPATNQTDIPDTEPIMLYNHEETHIKDVEVEKDYVLFPLIKILYLVGMDWIEDPRFDNYEMWCIEVQGEKYVIDWNNQLFTKLDNIEQITDNYGGTIGEKAKQYNLLTEFSDKYGSSYVSWATREIYIGNEALIQIMDEMGVHTSITWDAAERTVSVECQGDG